MRTRAGIRPVIICNTTILQLILHMANCFSLITPTTSLPPLPPLLRGPDNRSLFAYPYHGDHLTARYHILRQTNRAIREIDWSWGLFTQLSTACVSPFEGVRPWARVHWSGSVLERVYVPWRRSRVCDCLRMYLSVCVCTFVCTWALTTGSLIVCVYNSNIISVTLSIAVRTYLVALPCM